MAVRHDVHIVKTPKGYLVVPGYVVAAIGDTIVWKNYTGGSIEVLLPSVFPGRLQAPKGEDPYVELGPPEKSGFQPYAVYSGEANDLCIGQSTPGVIIKKAAVNAT
jgi:hypothetical protein